MGVWEGRPTPTELSAAASSSLTAKPSSVPSDRKLRARMSGYTVGARFLGRRLVTRVRGQHSSRRGRACALRPNVEEPSRSRLPNRSECRSSRSSRLRSRGVHGGFLAIVVMRSASASPRCSARCRRAALASRRILATEQPRRHAHRAARTSTGRWRTVHGPRRRSGWRRARVLHDVASLYRHLDDRWGRSAGAAEAIESAGGPARWGARRQDPGGTPQRPPARPARAAVGHGR